MTSIVYFSLERRVRGHLMTHTEVRMNLMEWIAGRIKGYFAA